MIERVFFENFVGTLILSTRCTIADATSG